VFHQYTLRIGGENAGKDARDAVAATLKRESIPHAVYYPIPLHRLPVFADDEAASRHGPLNEAERAADQVLSLPMHTELADEQIQRVAAVVDDAVEIWHGRKRTVSAA